MLRFSHPPIGRVASMLAGRADSVRTKTAPSPSLSARLSPRGECLFDFASTINRYWRFLWPQNPVAILNPSARLKCKTSWFATFAFVRHRCSTIIFKVMADAVDRQPFFICNHRHCFSSHRIGWNRFNEIWHKFA